PLNRSSIRLEEALIVSTKEVEISNQEDDNGTSGPDNDGGNISSSWRDSNELFWREPIQNRRRSRKSSIGG
ncbi:hypothetical protein BaRGS_00023439, partial [Batillaria attramentaria]